MATDITNIVDEEHDVPDTQSEDSVEPVDESELKLVEKITKMIKEDKDHHKAAFDRMREDMFMARHGYEKGNGDMYKANLAGRHVKTKTAALYAKNPRVVARRRKSLDFKVWDEDPKTLQMAMQAVAVAQQALGQLPIGADGQPVIEESNTEIQQAVQAFEKAHEIVMDFQQGMERRTGISKIGKTLEILFEHAMREQQPVDFKVGAKQMVRRTNTTGVGYVELAFQREKGQRPVVSDQLVDYQARLDHLKSMANNILDNGERELDPDDPEIRELEEAIAALQSQPEVVIREGLLFDYPASTNVIPDKLCTSLVGFVGSRHLTIQYLYTADQVESTFGVDLKSGYTGYNGDGKSDEKSGENIVPDDNEDPDKSTDKTSKGLVCVWKHYDKVTGLVYLIADGFKKFLRQPSKPDVFVENFWPVFALAFNEVESETELFPPSDVRLIRDQQTQYNASRQGLREHRSAARPRFFYENGAVEEEDAKAFATAAPFSVRGINVSAGKKIEELFVMPKIPGVDPNLYETGPIFQDIQLTVGSAEAQFGGVSKATATESAIAANSTNSSDEASVDDLDSFLTMVARAAGQILMGEMSEEQVVKVVGPGAEWPPMTLEEIADEIYLEVEAGSTGKPNQAVEVKNWQMLLPFILQMPNINPMWVAKETIRRLDDNADLTEALSANIPSIMAQNQLSQLSTGDPTTDPNGQGAAGRQNAPSTESNLAGSDAAFGSNQV